MSRNVEYEYDENEDKRRSPWLLIILGVLWLGLSALTVYFYIDNNDLEDQKIKVEAKKKELEIELESLEKDLEAKDTELASRSDIIKDLTSKLESAQKKLSELQRITSFEHSKLSEYKEKLKQHEDRILTIMEESEKAKTEMSVAKVENESLLSKIQNLQNQVETQKQDLEDKQKSIDELDEKIHTIYYASDFKFYDSKKEQNVYFKKGKIKRNFTVSFSIYDFEHKTVTKSLENITCDIKGIGSKNRGFKKSFEVEDVGGGKGNIKFVDERFDSGIYYLTIKHNNIIIGDASFFVK